MRWTTKATREVYRNVLHEWGRELPTFIAEWKEEGPGFALALALQLREDFGVTFGCDHRDPDSRLVAEACRAYLARVNWRQVAQRLVARAEGHMPIPADPPVMVGPR
jgi:hypothetical protein